MARDRKITNEDILKYEGLVEKYIRDSVVKNWNEASTSKKHGDISLGNTGYTVDDLRQYIRSEICVALYNYDPDFRTKDGKSVKEFTFVYQHIWFRLGGKLKKLTKESQGYGIWSTPIEDLLNGKQED